MEELRKLFTWHPSRKTCWQRQEIPTYFDGSVAKQWLRNCRKYHSHSHCRRPDQTPFELFVIDCNTREIRQHNFSKPYVALSYVWGGVSQPPIQDGKVPPNASAVITDAMEVTKKIGFRYLWVDQYCIEQTNHSARASQLANMHLVYSQAEVTIVAACGLNANDGLPGVNQSRYTYDDWACATRSPVKFRLPSIMFPSVVEKISGSKWSTRGWTFQEARLSRRLLCFIEDQCYWECRTMSCMELFSLDAGVWKAHEKREYHETKLSEVSSSLPFGPRSHFANSSCLTPSNYMRVVCNLISDYTRREISYDDDAIYAMMGVVEAVNVLLFPKSQDIYCPTTVMGLPLVLEDPRFIDARRQSLVCALSWYHRDDAHPIRRQRFPSWTWAGWKGRVYFHDSWYPMYDRWKDCEAGFYIAHAHFTTNEDREHQIAMDDVHCTTEVARLHFKAPEVPSHWLSYRPRESSDNNLPYSLLDHDCSVKLSEVINAPQILLGLETGLYRLALVNWWDNDDESEYKGCIWILKHEGEYRVRSGIIVLDSRHWDPDARIFGRPKRNDSCKIRSSIAALLQTTSGIEWEIS